MFFLLQVDQAIGISQLLLMGTLGNFTLSKTPEEKFKIENIQNLPILVQNKMYKEHVKNMVKQKQQLNSG